MMLKKMFTLLFFCNLFAIYGCTLLVAKAVYDSGEVKRVYASGFEETLSACQETLLDMGIQVTKINRAGVTVELMAVWSDKTPVTVKIVMKSVHTTQVLIRSGNVGLKDKSAIEIIQDHISHRLLPS
jgi:hypothetical protein